MAEARSRLTRFESQGWRGLHRADLFADPAAAIEAMLAAPGEMLAERASTITRRVDGPAGPCVLRHDRDPRWRPYRSSLVLHTAHVHQQLASAGLPVPEVQLACRRSVGGHREELLVTQFIPSRTVMDQLRALRPTPEQALPLLRKAGEAVAQLHRAGFMHGDMLPGNLLVPDDGGPLVFIDNERTRRLPGPLIGIARRRNLAQMFFRMYRGLPYRCLQQFFDAYNEAFPTPAAVRRRELAQVVRKVRERRTRRIRLRKNSTRA